MEGTVSMNNYTIISKITVSYLSAIEIFPEYFLIFVSSEILIQDAERPREM